MQEVYIDGQFIRNRITQLRLEKGVSEREMSLSLGMSESYIRNITAAQSLPSLDSLLNICEYLRITPAEFFDPELSSPYHTKLTMIELERLFGRNLHVVTKWLHRLEKKHADVLLDLFRMK